MKKSEALELINKEISVCQKCELSKTKINYVFGSGNPNSSIVFIGEAPGKEEDESGIPFVGRSGKLLNNILIACGLTRDSVFILNILKCRPPNNRTPTKDEADNCKSYLALQLKVLNPKCIICLGGCASKNLLDLESPISSLRGKTFEYAKLPVICTFHPSYALRNPVAKKDIFDDILIALNLCKTEVQ